MMSSKSAPKKLKVEQLKAKCSELNLPSEGVKKSLLSNLCKHFTTPSTPAPKDPSSEHDEGLSLVQLAHKLQLADRTVKNLQNAGYKTAADIIKMVELRKYPESLYMEAFISKNTPNEPARARTPSTPSELRQQLQRRQHCNSSSQRRPISHRTYHYNADESSSAESGKSSGSCSRSRSRGRLARLTPKARNLPRPHKFAFFKTSSGKRRRKLSATDISVNEFFAYSLRTATRLAQTASGDMRIAWLNT